MNLTLSTARVSTSATTRERRAATLALVTAFLLGTTTHALFRRSGLGLNFWLWDLLVLGAAAFLLRRGKISATAWGAMTASALLGFSIVLYESEWTLLIAVPSTLALLAVVPLLLRDRHDLAALARIPGRAFPSFKRAHEALVETARLPGIAAGGGANDALAAATRGLLVGLPTAGLFTFLLARDADFAHSLMLIRGGVGDAVVFLVWSLVSAASYLFTYAIHSHRDEAAVHPVEQAPLPPYRMVAADGWRALPTPAPGPRVKVVTWSVVVGQVALVFATFVGANLRHLFGGNALVRAEGGLTYATYLHEGFGALLFATALSVCLVLAGHSLLRPRNEGEPGAPVPGGRVLSFLEAALLVLTGTTVVSCWQRLRIYEDAYGASHLRLGVALVELSVLGVLVLTLGKVFFRRWTGHAGAVLVFATALAVFASGMNTDLYIARRNLDRAAAGKSLDVNYLASLSGDARAALDHPYVRADADLATRLAVAYCPPREGGLRAFRGVGRCSKGAR